jgi:hypothetical protein
LWRQIQPACPALKGRYVHAGRTSETTSPYAHPLNVRLPSTASDTPGRVLPASLCGHCSAGFSTTASPERRINTTVGMLSSGSSCLRGSAVVHGGGCAPGAPREYRTPKVKRVLKGGRNPLKFPQNGAAQTGVRRPTGRHANVSEACHG